MITAENKFMGEREMHWEKKMERRKESRGRYFERGERGDVDADVLIERGR